MRSHLFSTARFFGIVLFLLFSATTQVVAQSDFSLKSITATVNGTSTLHDWESAITLLEFQGSLETSGNTLKSIRNVTIKIPVKGIKSKEGKIMDQKTFEAFDADKNPNIIYSLSAAKVKIDTDQSVSIDASGSLTMAGTSRTISLAATGKVLANGDVQLHLSKKLKMTDFKMVPPKAVLGTIKVGDEITVNFDLVLTHLISSN